MVRSVKARVSDDAVREATGHAPTDWFARLDAEGATGWEHPAIARRLVEWDMDPWWAQGVAIRYEQERGIRIPGQQSDGTFAATVSKTLHGDLEAGYAHVVERLSAAWGRPDSSRAEGKRPYARWSSGDGSILVNVEVSGVGRLRVSVAHQRLDGPDAVEPAKERLRTALAALAS